MTCLTLNLDKRVCCVFHPTNSQTNHAKIKLILSLYW